MADRDFPVPAPAAPAVGFVLPPLLLDMAVAQVQI